MCNSSYNSTRVRFVAGSRKKGEKFESNPIKNSLFQLNYFTLAKVGTAIGSTDKPATMVRRGRRGCRLCKEFSFQLRINRIKNSYSLSLFDGVER